MSDVTVDSPAEEPVPRPSRQDLVVPQRQVAWPVVVGAVASAAAGFGLVFFLGVGSRRSATWLESPAAMVESQVETPGDPVAELPPAIESAALQPAGGRWAARGSSDLQTADDDEVGERYGSRPVSHVALTAGGSSPADPRPLSRFSSPDLPLPPLEPAVDPDPPVLERAGPADEPAEQPAEEGADEPNHESAAGASVVTEPSFVAEPGEKPGLMDEPDGEPSRVADVEAVADDPAIRTRAETPEVQSSEPSREDEPAVIAADSEPLSPPEPAPPAPLPPMENEPALRRSVGVEPPPAIAIPVGLPTPNPFAAAPPVVAPAPTGPAASVPHIPTGSAPGIAGPVPGYDDEAAEQGPSPLDAPTAVQGHGIPGPLQLEGVQTPQVALEKIGPREIQVGKPARYEIVVRNVGAATAHDVTLRDAVPQGTSLIATTPPAAPAAADDDRSGNLVWTLGVLPPGGETRVLMEVMPETEGEIGSVASVSFRTDATLRSRSTKPAVAIDCPPPKAVRIGGDVPVTITVSNPGTGIATGVVLEGFLPQTVSHRAGGELEFDVGQLRPGETKTIDLLLGTRGPGMQPLRLVARADGGLETDLDVPLEVTAPTLELAIDMPARRFLQRPATCTISMANSGTAAARAVELAVQLPTGMKFVKANNAGWHDERTHRVLWNLEELPPGEQGTVAVVVIPVQPGEQRIVVAARSTDGPSDQTVHTCQVEGLAALAFHVADSEDPIEVDGLTEYVIRVANEGTKAATGVQVAATLVGDLEPVEAQGPGGSRIENMAVAFEPLAKLGPGEEAVFRVRARGTKAGHQRIQVQLRSADQPEPITKEETTSVYDDR
ncbi:MAG: hypothetical protein WD072_02190 [Pirellulales bacterium]